MSLNNNEKIYYVSSIFFNLEKGIKSNISKYKIEMNYLEVIFVQILELGSQVNIRKIRR